MSKKVIILGTGGTCIDILDALNDINDFRHDSVYECVGFLDDDERTWGRQHLHVQVLGPLQSAGHYPGCFFVNGIGSPSNFWKKRDIISRTGVPIDRFETLIHPTAAVSQTSRLGHGVVLFQHVTVTSNARIGNHVIVLPNTVISHDAVIGDYTCIAGGACISGAVEIGLSCYVGSNCAIDSNVKIGDHCLVGMGAVVLHDIAENSVVVGNPARFLRKTIPEG